MGDVDPGSWCGKLRYWIATGPQHSRVYRPVHGLSPCFSLYVLRAVRRVIIRSHQSIMLPPRSL